MVDNGSLWAVCKSIFRDGVDPDGGFFNPVYGTNGERRGSTIEGNGGEAIVFDGDFQGLTKDQVLDNGGFLIGDNFEFMNGVAGSKIMSDFMTLPGRPDFDGVVTFWEARDWNKNGNGQALYVDVGKINFKSTRFSVQDFGDGDFAQVNFFNVYNNKAGDKSYLYRPALSDATLSFVYGTLRVNLLDVHTGAISLRTGDVGIHPDAFDRFDFANPLFDFLAGSGSGFDLIGYGQGYINTSKPPRSRPILPNPIRF